MRWRRFHPRPRRSADQPRPVDAELVDRLLAHEPDILDASSPDLTHRVMGQLGYMKASPLVVARRRRQRWFNRALLGCGILVFGAGVVVLSPALPGARGPHATTMPAAVERSIGRHQEQADRTLDVIRSLFVAPEDGASQAQPSWPIDAGESSFPAPTWGVEDGQPSDEIAPDVDQSAIAAVRWL
jgi:hypothetical protein